MMKKDLEKLKSVFSRTVHDRILEEGCGVLEAISALYEEFGIEEEEVGKFLTDNIKEELQIECEKNFTFKPSQKKTRLDPEFLL